MLTPQQLTHYHEQGFVIPDFRLPASTIQSIKDDFERLLVRYPEFRQNCPALLTYDTTFLNYARNPDILDMVTQILGEDIAVWISAILANLRTMAKGCLGIKMDATDRFALSQVAPYGLRLTIPTPRTVACGLSPVRTNRENCSSTKAIPVTTSFFPLNSCNPNLTKAPLWTLSWNWDRFLSTMSIWCTARNPTPPVNPAAA